MQVLTPSGYVDILDLNIGDEVIAYDINTGAQIINHLEGKTLWTPDMYPAEYTVGHYDENGDWVPPVLVNTSYEVFQRIQGDWITYRINNTWNLYKDQSVWANMNVIHAKDLQIGDIVYNDQDGDVVVTSIEVVEDLSWWKLDVSGDSSYIADDLTLHNASRYWVGGGSSTNWNATANTNWSSTSGGANNASVPTSADGVFFDDLGNSNSVISAGITVLSLSISSSHTATMTHNALLQIAGSVTFGANYTIAGTGNLQLNATGTITSNGKTWPNSLALSVAPGTFTLVGDFTINGILYVGAYNQAPAAVVNKTTTEKLIINGGLAGGIGTGPNNINGTAQLDFYGSTWTAVQVGLPMTVYGTVALSGSNLGANGAFTNLGTINAGTSTFNLGPSPSFNSNGAIWNNVTIGFSNATLSSDLIVNGTYAAFGGSNVYKTTNESIYVYGGFTTYYENSTFGGTATVILKGGTWTTTFNNTPFAMPITIDGNITISGVKVLKSGSTALRYISGVVTTTGSTLRLGSCSLFLSGMTLNNVGLEGTVTLGENLFVSGITTVTSPSTLNKTASEKLVASGGFTMSSTLAGTGTIELTGGTWSGNFVVNNPLIFNGNFIISGTVKCGASVTYTSGTITAVSSGNLTWPNSTQTIAFNAGNNMLAPMTFSGGTKTLSTDFSTGGLITISGATIINKTTSEVFTYGGGLTMSSTLGGTATVNLTGGTWSGGSTLSSPLNINGNITISGNVYYGTGTITYVSGTPVVTGSKLNLVANCTLNTSTMAWNDISFNAVSTIVTLTSNLIANGSLITNGGGANQINKTASETVTTFGGLGLNAGNLGGTALLYFNGGTWSGTWTLGMSITINGNVTLASGEITYEANTFTYLSGVVTTIGNTIKIGNGTTVFNTNGMLFNNFQFLGNSGTITLTSDLYINGALQLYQTLPFNKTTNEKVIINNGIFYNGGYSVIGTASVYLQGGTITASGTPRIGSSNFYFNGNITLNGTVYCSGGILTYLSGNLNTNNGIIAFEGYYGASTVIDFHKCPIQKVIVTTGQTITMNQFFTGTPQKPASITASTAAGQYTIAFTDSFERVAKNVIISGCILSKPMQLIVSPSPRVNVLRTTNSGVRYNNQSPNGFSKNTPAVTGLATGPALGLAGDPCFIKQS